MKSPKINNSKGGHVIVEKVRYMISDAAALAGVETHVLRYWEEELDLTIPRNEMGHRYYTRENIQEFQKIKELKEKGYQLKAIRMILHNKTPKLPVFPCRILLPLIRCPHVTGNIIPQLQPNRIDRTQIKPTCL